MSRKLVLQVVGVHWKQLDVTERQLWFQELSSHYSCISFIWTLRDVKKPQRRPNNIITKLR